MTMYLEHFGLKEAPFKITPHTEFFFAGANRGETLDALIYAITSGEGMVKVTGEVGAGKTMLCRVLIERLPETVETIYLAVPSLSRDEMLGVIAGDLGVDEPASNTTRMIRALQERLIEIHGEGRQVVALIDEAHAMPLETLEQIRLLSNLETNRDKLMQIVLFGQPELDEHLMLPNMRQLKERITHSFNLLPLPAHDIKDYLDFRLRAAGYKGPDLFSREALKLIAEASEGLTRRINIYADKTLLAAYAAGTHNVNADHVRAAISDTQIVLPAPRRRGGLAAAVAISLVAGGAIGFMAGRMTAPPITPTGTIVATPAISGATGKVSGDNLAASAVVAPQAIAPGTVIVAADKSNASPAGPANVEAGRSMAGEDVATGTTTAPPAPPAMQAKVARSAPSAAPATNAVTGDRDWLATRLTADRSRLGSLPDGHYGIQLMTADRREKAAIEAFVGVASRELKADELMVVQSGTAENPKVSVLYGNFAERIAASTEISRLPPRLTLFRPYVRAFGAVREDLHPGS